MGTGYQMLDAGRHRSLMSLQLNNDENMKCDLPLPAGRRKKSFIAAQPFGSLSNYHIIQLANCYHKPI